MLSAADIAEAKKRVTYLYPWEVLHQHDDCIRIAYEWLDAQLKTNGVSRTYRAFGELIKHWGGRYVSRSDVEVAAELHPEIRGKYPYYNIGRHLVRPSDARLAEIKEARTQDFRLDARDAATTYRTAEE